ncbi:type III pantothenate kinase [Methylacidimicrobium cyclopophantes]|uniref:Type III pantothenate kinase n=1 Tax=Methylacidimicrobium cyclopophantes TaxID=1041766 RepID=A0A5E6MQ01_9BACT|nr:type III pantothenate kinase [Methylacidimicrobium cyclopophantes]VVM07580.1 type III pantothenate kinase [Methylacidimicrobium cyclopophantes]
MAPSFLVVDVSNSFTKIAAVRSGRLCKPERRATAEVDRSFALSLAARDSEMPLVLASVVPSRTEIFRTVFSRRLFLVHGRAPLGFPIDYPKPAEIGADRLANAAAALHFWSPPVVVVDFGTATNFDIVDGSGAFCGGIIAPGLDLMTRYLHERTALLPEVRLSEPKRAFGRSTAEAIRVGAIYGYRGMIRGLLEGIRRELGGDRWTVVATGGHAALVARGLPEVSGVRPNLTLEGLRILGQRWLSAGDRRERLPPDPSPGAAANPEGCERREKRGTPFPGAPRSPVGDHPGSSP